MFTTLDEMVNLTNIGTLFAFILICLGIVILRFKDPHRERPFRVPFGPVLLPALGVVSSLGLIYYLPPSSWWRFVGWLAVGSVIYFLYGYRHSRLRHPRVPRRSFRLQSRIGSPSVGDLGGRGVWIRSVRSLPEGRSLRPGSGLHLPPRFARMARALPRVRSWSSQ